MRRYMSWGGACMGVMLLAAAGMAHAATTAFNKLPDYEKFGITITSSYHVRKCGVTVRVNQSRFVGSAAALENEGILDNVTPALMTQRPAYYVGQAMHEIVPTIIYHVFLRYSDASDCHFTFHMKGGEEDALYYGPSDPAFLSFVVNRHTMTQVDWYKASFDEIREVASRFEEDPAYATPAGAEENGMSPPHASLLAQPGMQDVTDGVQ
ncbi:hypothetical protein ACOZ4Y_07945 [Komagataeibacter rhaeticus]|nr:hypothetical protein [Komagataeibacter rhaeticus]KDU96497.1 hypothetical protein GLUCORHAEAF1_01320 [Komagataeibacter rhaeticus AF1]SAY49738.1 hypothetical protein KRIGEM_02719 [Komagataeibacter rhaeticus]